MKRAILLFIGAGLFCTIVDATIQRDPTRPIDYTAEEPIVRYPFKLTSIIIAPNRRVAVIDDHIVKVGDPIQDQQVLSIESNYVQLQGPAGITTLYLLNNPIKVNNPSLINKDTSYENP